MHGGDIDRFLHTRDRLLTKGGKKYVKRRDADACASGLVHQMVSQRRTTNLQDENGISGS